MGVFTEMGCSDFKGNEKSIGVRIFLVANVRIKGWVGWSAVMRTLFRFVNRYGILDDPLDKGLHL